MKNRLVLLSIFLALILFLCGCLSACDQSQTGKITDVETTCDQSQTEKTTDTYVTCDHSQTEWIIDTEAGCQTIGWKHQVCVTCGKIFEKTIIVPTGHTIGEWIIDSEATCTTSGCKRKVCTNCGETLEIEGAPATGHTTGEWIIDIGATCLTSGSKHKICTTCGETVEKEFISPLGHNAGDWITQTMATCTSNGVKHKICTNCGEELEIKFISAFGHTAGEWIIDTEATCTTNGSKHKVCTACGETIERESISALGHNIEEHIEVEATLHSAGLKSYICTNCGLTRRHIILPLSEEYGCDLTLEELADSTSKSLIDMAQDTFEWNIECNTVDDYLYPYGDLSTYIEIKQFVLELTKNDTTEREKVYHIYDWICKNIAYDSAGVYNSISETWENKAGVCAQFVALAHDMLSAVGIQSAYIGGYVYDGFGKDPNELNTGTILRNYYKSGHAIVACYADGKVLLCDPTWGQKLGDNYFDMSDEFLGTYFIPRDMNDVTIVADNVDIRMYEGPMFKIGHCYFFGLVEYSESPNGSFSFSGSINNGVVTWKYQYKSNEDSRICACYSSKDNTKDSTYYYLPDARAVLMEDYFKYISYEQLYFDKEIVAQVEFSYVLYNGGLYKLESGTLEYRDQLDNAETITIPNAVNGIPVCGISTNTNNNIKKVTVENGVLYVYGYWPNLEEITLPASVYSWAGYSSEKLEKINISEDNETYKVVDNVLYSKDGTKLILYPATKKDTIFVLPQGVKEASFILGNNYLTEIVWNNDIESIDCMNFPCIKELILPDSLLSIANIGMMDNLETFHVSKNVEIERNSFGSIANIFTPSNFKNVTVDPDNPYYQIIDGVLFSKDGKTLIKYFNYLTDEVYVVPDGTETIGAFAFLNCTSIKRVIMPSSLSTLGQGVFIDSSIESIDLTNVRKLNGNTFAGCDNLTYLVLPVGMESIGAQEFFGSSIETMVIENQNMSVEDTSFAYCGGMKIFLTYNGITNKEEMWETYGCYVYEQSQWEYVDGKPTLK